MSFPCLVQPDFSKEFFLHTDASGSALGAVLTQQDADGNHRAIGYASRLLTDVERRYSATESECLAVAWAVEHFRPWLHGHKFHLFSDHSALQYLLGGAAARSTNRKHHRWIAELQGYDFTTTHKAGEDNVVPDALSRCFSVRASMLASLFLAQFTLHHRPSTAPGFSIRMDADQFPLATPETLAAHFLAGFEPSWPHQPQSSALVAFCQSLPYPVHALDIPPPDVVSMESAVRRHLAISPRPGNTITVLPDLRQHSAATSHDGWLQQLQGACIVGSIPAAPGSRFPSLLLGSLEHHRHPFPGLRFLPRVQLQVNRPIHLVELCAGIGAFLEAFLRNGYMVSRYTYCDMDSVARTAARHRLWLLHGRYPRLFPVSAFQSWDSALPHDVHHITPSDWASLPTVDVIAAGPPC